ncbi:MAG: hypothetical protein LBQ61_02845 [Spirochaetales bacterium]|nr:hypothetical protein [Spirochaetales bacterium]
MLTPVQAALNDFKEKVEAAEETENPPRRPSSSSRSDHNEEAADFWFALFRVLFYYNLHISYGPFPYSPRGFILPPGFIEDVDGGEVLRTQRAKFFSLAGSAEGIFLEGLGFGGWARLSGPLLKILGPEMEYFYIRDSRDNFRGSRIGGALYIIQSNPFTLKVYLQYLKWEGVLSMEGAVLGFEVLSYPKAPLSFRLRMGTQDFDSSHVNELEIEAGLELNRFNFYGGFRLWTLKDNGETLGRYPGFFAGVRCFF